jgi:hypothetical protein
MVVICLGDGDGQALDLTERIRQLNEELLKEPLPPEIEGRERSIKFKETLVDFVAPTPEPDADLDDSDVNNESGVQQQESPRDNKEKQYAADESVRSDPVSGQKVESQSIDAPPVESGVTKTATDTTIADRSPDGDRKERNL